MLGAEGISVPTPISLPLATNPGAKVQPTTAAKLGETAREFEATFLSLLLKEMRQTLEPDGGLFPGDSGDVQGGLFDLFLGRHLADAGGVGMADAIVRQMKVPPAATPTTPDAAPTDPKRNRAA